MKVKVESHSQPTTSVHLPYLGWWAHVDKPLTPVRPQTLPTIGQHCPVTGIKLHCLVTEARVCVWITCQKLLPDRGMAGSWTHDVLTITPLSHTTHRTHRCVHTQSCLSVCNARARSLRFISQAIQLRPGDSRWMQNVSKLWEIYHSRLHCRTDHPLYAKSPWKNEIEMDWAVTVEPSNGDRKWSTSPTHQPALNQTRHTTCFSPAHHTCMTSFDTATCQTSLPHSKLWQQQSYMLFDGCILCPHVT